MTKFKHDKFYGDYQTLQKIVERSGVTGSWAEIQHTGHQFKTHSGDCLNWWQKTHTLNYQNTSPDKLKLESAFDTYFSSVCSQSDVPADPATILNNEDDDKRILEVKHEMLIQDYGRLRTDHDILFEIANALSSSSDMSEAGD